MAYKDLRAFIEALEGAGELCRVPAEVGPRLEIAEITDRVSKAGGPALLFERVQGSAVPVLINAFGSERRMNLALQVPSGETLAGELAALLEARPPAGLWDKLRMVPRLMDLAAILPSG